MMFVMEKPLKHQRRLGLPFEGRTVDLFMSPVKSQNTT